MALFQGLTVLQGLEYTDNSVDEIERGKQWGELTNDASMCLPPMPVEATDDNQPVMQHYYEFLNLIISAWNRRAESRLHARSVSVSIHDTEYHRAQISGFWNGFAIVRLNPDNYTKLQQSLIDEIRAGHCEREDYDSYLTLKKDPDGLTSIPAGLCVEADPIRVPVLHEGFSPQDLTAYVQAKLKKLGVVIPE